MKGFTHVADTCKFIQRKERVYASESNRKFAENMAIL